MILREPEPVLTAHLFAPMRLELVRVLGDLSEAEWRYPTACTGWTVKDVALHLLGDDLGLLSRRRDGFTHTDTNFEHFDELVAFINLQNDIWLRAGRRISPALLIDLLGTTGRQVSDWIKTLEMTGTGAPVNWVSSAPAPQWLEVAREYTEYWMHHQHICDAVSVESLKEREYFAPVLQTFVRALPRAYTRAQAPLETLVKLHISGEAGDTWYIVRERGGWSLYEHTNLEPAVTLTVDPETVWRLFSKGIRRRDAEGSVKIEGNAALAEPFFTTTAILA